MCGFFVSFGEALSKDQVQSIQHSLNNRGPDDQGHWQAAETSLQMVHCRLAIQQGRPGAAQPRVRKGHALAFNGEIYNHDELRSELQREDVSFQGGSDTELVLTALMNWGVEAFDRFEGMFALSYWDPEAQRLLLARDPLGQKPLYYHRRDNEMLQASSQIEPLLEQAGRKADPASLSWYLSLGYVPAPRTGFFQVKAVPPGNYLVWEDGAVRDQVQYWDPMDQVRAEPSEGDRGDQLRNHLEQAVRQRGLHGEADPAVWLSGGVDSSLILELLTEVLGSPPATYSVGFGRSEYDERPAAARWAQKLGCEHHEARVEPKLAQRLPRLARGFGQPFADSSAVPTDAVAQLTGEEHRVALSGDGGDELFGGYRRYRAMRWLANVRQLMPEIVRQGLSSAGDWLPVSNRRDTWGEAVRILRLLEQGEAGQYGAMVGLGGDREKQNLGKGPLGKPAARGIGQWLVRWFRRVPEFVEDPAQKAMLVDLLSYLPGDLLVKSDVCSMQWSVECRAPFLDKQLIEWRLRQFGSTGSTSLGKGWLQEAFEDRLTPDHWSRSKQGFGVPLGKWWREDPEAEYLKRKLVSPHDEMDRLVDRRGRERLHRQLIKDQEDQTPLMWALVMMRVWMEEMDVRV